MDAYRRMFTEHPANLIVLRDFLNPDGAEKLSAFLGTEAQYETLYGLYSAMNNHPEGLPTATETDWLNADDSDRFFRLRKFVGLSKDSRLTPNLVAYMKFRNAFNDFAFRNFFISITGLDLDLVQSTFHSFVMKPGDFLRHHDDTGNNYLLAFVLYLAPRWQPEFGGQLEMTDPKGNVTTVEPEYNSLVLFKVNPRTKHLVTPIQSDENVARATISGWMHQAAAKQ